MFLKIRALFVGNEKEKTKQLRSLDKKVASNVRRVNESPINGGIA